MTPTILLVGGRTPVALDLARQLGRARARVVVADVFRHTLCAESRFVWRAQRIPSPRLEPDRWLAALCGLIRAEGVDLVVPTGEDVFWVARDRGALGVPATTGAYDVLVGLHDKVTFAARIRGLDRPGIRAPGTWPAEVAAERAREQDVVLKPRSSRFGNGVFVVRRGERPPEVDVGRYLVQERVIGREVSSLSWIRHGVAVGHVVYEPLVRFPTGPAVCARPVFDPATRERLRAVAESLGTDGAVGLDAIVEADGTVVPIECNPRLTSGVHFLPDLGELVLGAEPTSVTAADRPRMIALATVMLGWRRPSAWRSIANARDVVWDADDPWPFFAQPATMWELGTVRRRTGVTIREAASELTRFDG
ncbi:MAG: ATP-grasp domain-containing protein [Myxococcota bacterium]